MGIGGAPRAIGLAFMEGDAMTAVEVTARVGLNLRRGPESEFPILAHLPRGMVLERLSASPDGEWLEVRRATHDGVLVGWAATRYLVPRPAGGPEGEPPWLAVAKREIGVRDYPFGMDNPRIAAYHEATALRATIDKVPWCSAFANWCMRQAGLCGTDSAAARSWLAWGRLLPHPRTGCVVVLRGGANPAQGHVAFYIAYRGAFLDLLGGDQGDQVSVYAYPTRLLLGYRWPG